MNRAVLATSFLAAFLVATSGRAQPEDAASLQAEIESAAVVTGQSDCAAACRALGSMRRATERLCAIEPGEACADARRRTRDAEARVRASCPACEAGGPAAPRPVQATDTAKREEVAATAPKRGCGACAVHEGEGAGGALAAALALAIAFARRASRRRRG